MNKKILLPLLTFFFLVAIVTIGILQYRGRKTVITETTPVIPTSTKTTPRSSFPVATTTKSPEIPQQTNLKGITKTVPDEVSIIEIEKFFDSLPIRQNNFPTSAKINTTINIFSQPSDPDSILRLEIYGINYNNSLITGPNAIAFKESFLEAKRQLVARGVNIKNLQLVYGNRQYIQDTASYWVKTFKLLD